MEDEDKVPTFTSFRRAGKVEMKPYAVLHLTRRISHVLRLFLAGTRFEFHAIFLHFCTLYGLIRWIRPFSAHSPIKTVEITIVLPPTH
jgi:hypothetical protein